MAEFTSKKVFSSTFSRFLKDLSLSKAQSGIYFYYRDTEEILVGLHVSRRKTYDRALCQPLLRMLSFMKWIK